VPEVGWKTGGSVIEEEKVVKTDITKPAQLYKIIRTFANKSIFFNPFEMR